MIKTAQLYRELDNTVLNNTVINNTERPTIQSAQHRVLGSRVLNDIECPILQHAEQHRVLNSKSAQHNGEHTGCLCLATQSA